MKRVLKAGQFLQDVATHAMTVIRDDGVNRHVKFRRSGTRCMGFDLITWPGHLCYSGDMGTYVFARIEDMFEFFRATPTDLAWADRHNGETLYINLGYWQEKVLAADKSGGIEAFDPDLFIARVRELLKQREAPPAVVEACEEEVIGRAHDGEHEAMRAGIEFEHDGFRFDDFWEINCRDYTYSFVWCCYAIAWGIQVYDAAIAGEQK